jgi:hypothetical protein
MNARLMNENKKKKHNKASKETSRRKKAKCYHMILIIKLVHHAENRSKNIDIQDQLAPKPNPYFRTIPISLVGTSRKLLKRTKKNPI